MSRHARAAAVACFAALFALSIVSMELASLRDEPVRIRLLGEPRAAAVGVPFEGTLRIEAYRDASLSSFTLAGPGWTVEALEAPVATLLRRGESLDVRFRAQPVFPDAALRFSYLADGVPGFIPVHLSPALLEPGRGTSPD